MLVAPLYKAANDSFYDFDRTGDRTGNEFQKSRLDLTISHFQKSYVNNEYNSREATMENQNKEEYIKETNYKDNVFNRINNELPKTDRVCIFKEDTANNVWINNRFKKTGLGKGEKSSEQNKIPKKSALELEKMKLLCEGGFEENYRKYSKRDKRGHEHSTVVNLYQQIALDNDVKSVRKSSMKCENM